MKPVTKADLSRVGKLARDFKLKGTTPDEIRARLAYYRSGWNAADTPEALLKHWDRFAKAQPDNRPGRISRVEAPEGKYDNVGYKMPPDFKG